MIPVDIGELDGINDTGDNCFECQGDGFEDNNCDGYCDCCTIANNEDCNNSGCWWVVNGDYPDGMWNSNEKFTDIANGIYNK